MIVTTPDQLAEVVEAYTKFDAWAFDTETHGNGTTSALDPLNNTVFWIQLAGPGRADVIPMGHPTGEVLRKATRTKPLVATPAPDQLWDSDDCNVFAALKPLFFSDQIKVGHNIKFDLKSVAKYYHAVPSPPYADTMIMAHLLNENRRRFALDAIIQSDFGYEYPQLGKNLREESFLDAARYGFLDVKFTWLLYRHFLPLIADEKLTTTLRLEMDLLEALTHVELRGVQVDRGSLEEGRIELTQRLQEIAASIYQNSGRIWNIRSNPQRVQVLYQERGLRPKKFTPGGAPSTDAEALAPHAKRDKVVAGLLAHAETDKLLSTYIVGLEKHIDDDDRVRTSYRQATVVTGRLSSSEPNLQNIPRPGSPMATRIRGFFIARPGSKLCVGDYDQIELRVLAHYAKDKTLLDGFAKGIDPHSLTAATLLGKRPEDLTVAERNSYGKTMNFAVVYGAGPATIAARSGMTEHQAKKFLETYWARFPGVKDWIQEELWKCRMRHPPHVKTVMGRKRRLPEIMSHDFGTMKHAERQAINSIIQGSAGDALKIATVYLRDALVDNWGDSDVFSPGIVLSVHDELVVESPDDIAEEVARIMLDCLTGVDLFSVPLTTTIKVIDRWSEK